MSLKTQMEQAVHQLLNEIADNDDDMKDKCEFEVIEATNEGDGMFGHMFEAKVRYGDKLSHFMIKCDQVVGSPLPCRPELHANELLFYTDIVPKLKQIAKAHFGEEDIVPCPKFLGNTVTETIAAFAMTNMRTEGYEMLDRKSLADSAHITIALKTIGKYHALAYALKQKKPQEFAKLKESIKRTRIPIQDSESFNGLTATACNDMVSKFERNPSTPADLKKSLKKYKRYMVEVFEKYGKYDGVHNCLLHGDLWTNNILFKYKEGPEGRTPTDVCLVDWQLTNVGTPVYDLAYFLFSSSPPELLASKYKDYLQTYYESLTNMLERFKVEPKDVMPHYTLLKDWCSYSKMGLTSALLLHKLKLTDKREVVQNQVAASSSSATQDHVAMTLGNRRVDEPAYWERIERLVYAAHEMQAL